MTFKWLPDYELDPHPRLTWFTECCFDFVVMAFYRKEEMLPPDYCLESGTLIVSNHQRDADIPILTTVLCRREGVRIRYPLPFYASREDFFRRGFLADHLHSWPRPLRMLLDKVSLAWFFRIVRAEPMRRVPEFTLAEAFRELEGGSGGEWLNARGRREAVGGTAVSGHRARGPVHTRFWGLRRLHGAAHAVLGPGFRDTVAAQLERFAALLDAGRLVYFAPEGTISRNGRFGRIRAGAWLITRLTAQPPPILPLGLSYDPLGPGRLRVVIRVGRPLKVYHTDSRVRFDSLLRHEIGKLYPVNASHLVSRFLVAGPERFTGQAVATWLERAAASVIAAGLTLDPLLAREKPETIAARRLAWLARKRLVAREGDRWYNRWPHAAASAPGWRDPAGVVAYCDNALDDLLRTCAPGLAGALQP